MKYQNFRKQVLKSDSKKAQTVYNSIRKRDRCVMVYKLYELEYEEVLVVEPEFSLSKQEYDNFEI